MSDVTRWVKVGVAMESAAASDKTISAITLANPGVVSSTAHGYSDGDYVRFNISGGMPQLNGRVIRVSAKTTDAWTLEGLSTSSYDAFTEGVANKLTFGTAFDSLMGISPAGGEQQYANYRLIHGNDEQQIPTFRANQRYTFKSLWDPANAALIAAEAAADAGTEKAFKITFSNGKIFVVSGFVEATLAPAGTELVECEIGFNCKGRGKAYAS